MYRETEGRVIAVSRQWWLKVNTKPVRMHSMDGAIFPHILTVSYTVDGRSYTKRKWVSAGKYVPAVGSSVTVQYDGSRPGKAKVL